MWQPVHFFFEINTCGMVLPFPREPGLEADVDAELGQLGLARHALLVPPAQAVVLLQGLL